MADGARKKRILSIVTAVLLVIVAACVAACNGNADTKPTLTFMNGDSVFRTYELSAGEAITDLGMPAKEGYTFTGWKDGEGHGLCARDHAGRESDGLRAVQGQYIYHRIHRGGGVHPVAYPI